MRFSARWTTCSWPSKGSALRLGRRDAAAVPARLRLTLHAALRSAALPGVQVAGHEEKTRQSRLR